MRLDHLSYATTHEQLADTVQRIGSRVGCTFTDGGVHPRFGTRNFTASLKEGQYLEVVCPLDHPATENSVWGRAVSKKASDGGGWLTWVFSTDDLEKIESKFGRAAAEGHRTRPDGSELVWKQIGVKEITESKQLPFFIKWLSEGHPSKEGIPTALISKIIIADGNKLAESWFKEEIVNALGTTTVEFVAPEENDGEIGIVAVEFQTKSGSVILE